MPDFFLSAMSFSPIQKKLLDTMPASAPRSFLSATPASCLRKASRLGSSSGFAGVTATGLYGLAAAAAGGCGAGCVAGRWPPAGGNWPERGWF